MGTSYTIGMGGKKSDLGSEVETWTTYYRTNFLRGAEGRYSSFGRSKWIQGDRGAGVGTAFSL